ncbi:hypothetical protein NKDENANG_00913 [Candidatus Entotheonellaceae bacterium PAL068K]
MSVWRSTHTGERLVCQPLVRSHSASTSGSYVRSWSTQAQGKEDDMAAGLLHYDFIYDDHGADQIY